MAIPLSEAQRGRDDKRTPSSNPRSSLADGNINVSAIGTALSGKDGMAGPKILKSNNVASSAAAGAASIVTVWNPNGKSATTAHSVVLY